MAVYDVTGPLGVPTVLSRLGPRAGACASGLTWTSAVRDALEQTLLYYQAAKNDQPDYAPRVFELPERMYGKETAGLRLASEPDLTKVIAVLQEQGHSPVVVPVDHDPEVNKVLPYIVHVVLTNE